MAKLRLLLLSGFLFLLGISYAAEVSVPSGKSIQAAIDAAADGDVILLESGGVYMGSLNITKSITLMAADGYRTKPIISDGAIRFKATKGINFKVSGIEFASAGERYFTRLETGDSIAYLEMKDLLVHGYDRSILRASDSGEYLDSMLIENCHFYNNSGGGYRLIYADKNDCPLRYFKLANTTINGFDRALLELDSDVKKTVIIDRCTINGKTGDRKDGSLFDIHGAEGSVFSVTNSIITAIDTVSMVWEITESVSDTIMNCRFFFDETAADTTNAWSYMNEFIKEDPMYADPADYNLGLPKDSPLLTAGTDGGALGDPRWVPAPLEPGLAAHWKLDEASGEVIKEEIAGADGAIVGAGVARVNGVDGRALDFSNAANDAIVIVEDSEATSGINFTSESFTVSLFARYDISAEDPYLFLKGDNGSDGPNGNGNRYAIQSKEGELRFVLDDDVTKTQLGVQYAGYPSNEWAHIVGVRNVEKDSVYLYLNGTEIGRMLDETGALDVDSQRVVIGNYHTLDKSLPGAIDDIRVYNKALTAAEISQMANDYLIFVSGITVSADSTTIPAGATLQINAAIAPMDATNKTIGWSVNDEAVATINATSGLLTAVAEGTVTVIATAGDGSGVSGTVDITVVAAAEPPDATLSDLTIDVGTLTPSFDAETFSYSADVPDGTTTVMVTATPTDPGAGVAGDGSVDVSSGSGKSTVVVTAVDGVTTQTYTIDFTVLVGVDQNELEKVSFYYNSFSDQLKINNASRVELVEIYSLTGTLLSTEPLHNQESMEINTSKLSNGLYVVRMKLSEEGMHTGKFIKY